MDRADAQSLPDLGLQYFVCVIGRKSDCRFTAFSISEIICDIFIAPAPAPVERMRASFGGKRKSGSR